MQNKNNWKLSETRKWFVGKWIFYDCYHGNYTVYDWYQNMTKYDFFGVLFDTEIEYHDFFEIAIWPVVQQLKKIYMWILKTLLWKQVEMKRNYPFYGNQSTALLSKDKVSMKFHQIMSIFITDQTQ